MPPTETATNTCENLGSLTSPPHISAVAITKTLKLFVGSTGNAANSGGDSFSFVELLGSQ